MYNPGLRPVLSAKAVHLSYTLRVAAEARENPTAVASPSPALSARLIRIWARRVHQHYPQARCQAHCPDICAILTWSGIQQRNSLSVAPPPLSQALLNLVSWRTSEECVLWGGIMRAFLLDLPPRGGISESSQNTESIWALAIGLHRTSFVMT